LGGDISASLLTLEERFYSARTQAPNMFINLEESPLAKQQVISTLYGARNAQRFTEKDRFNDENGKVILKMQGHEKLIFLTIDGMRIKEHKKTGRGASDIVAGGDVTACFFIANRS
jgi:hypothetical protein